jgi:Na+/H+-dicarboxylate symporter
MDKKLDPIEAVELSWKLTRGYGWQIFLMGFVSIFIVLIGLLLFIVGILPALMWVSSSFAAMYESVLREKEPRVEIPAAETV